MPSTGGTWAEAYHREDLYGFEKVALLSVGPLLALDGAKNAVMPEVMQNPSSE